MAAEKCKKEQWRITDAVHKQSSFTEQSEEKRMATVLRKHRPPIKVKHREKQSEKESLGKKGRNKG